MSSLLPPLRRAIRQHGIAFLLVAIAGALLYVPFLGNPALFDDANLYATRGLAERATIPFDLQLRTLPYFTIAAIEVLADGSMVANRLFGLAMHALCGFLVARFVLALLGAARGVEAHAGDRPIAIAAGVLFAVHPVAVYGAGYLAQRTTVFATVFTLASVLLLIDAIRQERFGRAVAAAMLYALAALSKEHALMVLWAAALGVPLLMRADARGWKVAGVYLVAGLPAFLWVAAQVAGLLGMAYEPFVQRSGAFEGAAPWGDTRGMQWFASVGHQCGFFFEYWLRWWLPLPGWLSADLRPDLTTGWTLAGAALRIVTFAAVTLASVVLVIRGRGPLRAAGFGVAFAATLFVTELGTVRFQEPFVLYRSYLWAPGWLLAAAALVAALAAHVDRRVVATAAAVIAVVFGGVAHGRLETWRTERALWEDAAAKLPEGRPSGTARIYLNRGLARLRDGEREAALADFAHINATTPSSWFGRFGEAVAALRDRDHALALERIDEVLERSGGSRSYMHYRAAALEGLGRDDEALAVYRELLAGGDLLAGARIDVIRQRQARASR